MAVTLWLARHGQTTFNAEGRYQGALDSPLTGAGVEQANRVGKLIARLTGGDGDRSLWTSPLGRARQTAEIIGRVAGLAAPPRIDPRLAEVSLGLWDGLTDEEIEDVSPGACDGATRFDWFFRAPNGESYEQAEARLGSWLAEVKLIPGCHIVVSHGLSGRILRGRHAALSRTETLKLDVPQDAVFRLDGEAIQRFDVDEG